MNPEQHRRLAQLLTIISLAEAGPTSDDLAAAPLLDLWRPLATLEGSVVLWGQVSGHPRLGSTTITTSRLIAFDPKAGWARTLSRWYRLGQPFSAFEADLARAQGIQEASKGIVSFELAGFLPIDDPDVVDRLMGAFITRVRRMDAER